MIAAGVAASQHSQAWAHVPLDNRERRWL